MERAHHRIWIVALVATACGGAALDTAPSTAGPPSVGPLRLVVIGDSFVGWSDWPERYGDLMSAAMGVEVVVDTTLAGPGTPRRLDQLESSGSAPDIVRSADVLVVQPQPGWAAEPMFNEFFGGGCGSDVAVCLEPHLAAYRDYLDEYLDLLVELAPDDAVIRIVSSATWAPDGFYAARIREHPELRPALVGVVVAMMGDVKAAADARDLVFVDVNAAFNGPDYLDAAPEEYLVSDRLHLAEQGSIVVAALLHELGYEPIADST